MKQDRIGAFVKDNHYVVTGGTTGIGAQICSQLRKLGAKMTVLDLHKPEIAPDHYIAVDLNDNASIDNAIAQINTPVDGLFNIAGLPPRPGLRESVLRVNFFGLRRLTLAVVPQMHAGGAIVNMSSRAGAAWRENIEQVKALMALSEDADVEAFCQKQSIDDTRAYHLSKEAVTVWSMMQTEPLIAHDLRMNAVSPAAVDTNILADFKEAFGERVDKMIGRLGRVATPDEVASAALFLMSPQSAWIKGIDLGIDGGMLAAATSDALGLTVKAS